MTAPLRAYDPTANAAGPDAVVVCVRHPDFSNAYQAWSAPDLDVDVVDLDLGYADLRDPEEYAEWAAGHRETADLYRRMGWHEVADYIIATVEDAAPDAEGDDR